MKKKMKKKKKMKGKKKRKKELPIHRPTAFSIGVLSCYQDMQITLSVFFFLSLLLLELLFIYLFFPSPLAGLLELGGLAGLD